MARKGGNPNFGENQKGNNHAGKSIKAVDNETLEVFIFKNQREASEGLGINPNLISRVYTTGKQRKDYSLYWITPFEYGAQETYYKEHGEYSLIPLFDINNLVKDVL
jgi:hypothetical protein